MALEESILRRLAFIKFIYYSAVEQSKKPEPLSAASILTFHDAVELFLQLASEYHNVGKSGTSFMDYWDLLSPKLPSGGITQKESMRRLNSARVELKHHGTLPSILAIEGFRASTTSFFEENTSIVFNTLLSDISLIDLVQFEQARDKLKEAEDLIKSGKVQDALNNIALSFHFLINDYEKRKIDEFGRSPFFFGGDMSFLDSFFWDFDQLAAGTRFRNKMTEFVDKVGASLAGMSEAIKILSLKIDYRRYIKFKLLTPIVVETFGSPPSIMTSLGSGRNPTVDDAQFCIDFVIESAITFREFDFSFDTN